MVVSDLKELLSKSAKLRSLCLDFNGRGPDSYRFLQLLAQTTTLSLIQLRLSASDLGTTDEERNGTDPDYDAAECLMKYLHSQRRGAPLNMILNVYHSVQPQIAEQRGGSSEWDSLRKYFSNVDGNGAYQQWGSERIGGERIEEVVNVEEEVDLDLGDV
ncbi:hypothetical protein DL98DRAFT_265703 [Cadophora sp. DSE1049]|nr:hypothetical protein DL98DRAFT_265703 [Cadophora sp. DSE1049]